MINNSESYHRKDQENLLEYQKSQTNVKPSIVYVHKLSQNMTF